MASEIGYLHDDTGEVLYAVIRNPAGQCWNGAAFEARTVANWGNYDIALTETPASSYFYVGTFPAIAVGFYRVDIYVQGGASPAIGDRVAAVMYAYWNATALIVEGADVRQFVGVAAIPGAIPAVVAGASGGLGVLPAGLKFPVTLAAADCGDGYLPSEEYVATKWYVDQDNGNDANNGHSWAKAKRTCVTGLSSISEGDRAYVRASSNVLNDPLSAGACGYVEVTGMLTVSSGTTPAGFAPLGTVLRGGRYGASGANTTALAVAGICYDCYAEGVSGGKALNCNAGRVVNSIIIGPVTVIGTCVFIGGTIEGAITGAGTAILIGCRQISGTNTATVVYADAANVAGYKTGIGLTDARLGALTDWIDAGRLDLILDSVVSAVAAQAIRDAMKLAPSSGTPAAGSVDLHLDDIQTKTARIGSATATYTGFVTAGGEVTIYAGDAHLAANSDAFEVTVEDYAGPTVAAGKLRFLPFADYSTTATTAAVLEVAATFTVSGDDLICSADLTAAQTAALSPTPPAASRNYQAQFRAQIGANWRTIWSGRVSVKKGIASSP